jgi:hypothetical protein
MRRLVILAAAVGTLLGAGIPAAQAVLPDGDAASTSVACVWSEQVGYGACVHRLIPDEAPRPPWR